MIKVYTLLVTYPYEFSVIRGVYATRDKAEAAKKEEIENDKSGGYDEFKIEEFEVN